MADCCGYVDCILFVYLEVDNFWPCSVAKRGIFSDNVCPFVCTSVSVYHTRE